MCHFANQVIKRTVYNRECLIGIKTQLKHYALPDNVYSDLKRLNLLKPTKRGKKSPNPNNQSRIKAVITDRNLTVSSGKEDNAINKDNLIYLIPKKETNGKSGCWLDFALWNARSVKNKTLYIHDFVTENKLDFLALTETWLSSDSDEGDIIESLKPNGYSFYQKPRNGKSGGGVGVLIKTNIKVKQIQSKGCNSFEYLELILKFQSQSVRLLIVYRPPNCVHYKYADFEDDFTDLLSVVAVKPEELLLLGDFNIL